MELHTFFIAEQKIIRLNLIGHRKINLEGEDFLF